MGLFEYVQSEIVKYYLRKMCIWNFQWDKFLMRSKDFRKPFSLFDIGNTCWKFIPFLILQSSHLSKYCLAHVLLIKAFKICWFIHENFNFSNWILWIRNVKPYSKEEIHYKNINGSRIKNSKHRKITSTSPAKCIKIGAVFRKYFPNLFSVVSKMWTEYLLWHEHVHYLNLYSEQHVFPEGFTPKYGPDKNGYIQEFLCKCAFATWLLHSLLHGKN